MNKMNRRQFLRGATTVGLGIILAACTPASKPQPEVAVKTAAPAQAEATAMPTGAPTSAPTTAPTQASATEVPTATQAKPTDAPTAAPKVASPVPSDGAYLAVVRGNDPEAITMRALAAIGGIERFVKKGYNVVVKPNICNAYHTPEYASTTNPQVVATLVKLCLGAGAKSVRVMDFPFGGSPQVAYVKSGIEEAVKAAGGQMELMSPMGFRETKIPQGVDLKEWEVYEPVLEADLLINVPIAKHHNLARLTLGGKNLMGVISDRGSIHRNLGQRIADITSVVKPQLTVIDAVRILMANGPTGGNLADVKEMNTIIASHDIVAADAYVTRFFDRKPEDIGYVAASAKMGLGTMDLDSIKIDELEL